MAELGPIRERIAGCGFYESETWTMEIQQNNTFWWGNSTQSSLASILVRKADIRHRRPSISLAQSIHMLSNFSISSRAVPVALLIDHELCH
jgi:hypothetical protein